MMTDSRFSGQRVNLKFLQSSLLPKKLVFLLFIFLTQLHPAGHSCGTLRFFTQNQSLPPPPAGLSKSSYYNPPSRVYLSNNFAIFYTLWGVHGVTRLKQDSALFFKADSILRIQAGTVYDREYNAILQLDYHSLPHPTYISKMASVLEETRSYFVDSLNYRAPVGARSVTFYTRNIPLGRYPVEVLDLGTAYPEMANRGYYAVTYSNQIIQIENDFQYWDSQKNQNTPLVMNYNQLTPPYINNYYTDWEKGLRVTLIHEFYHAIQFTTLGKSPSKDHVWYEASATAMEEWRAQDVNDYLQYVPAYFQTLSAKGALNSCMQCEDSYGVAIFSDFLNRNFTPHINKDIWQNLAKEPNLSSALLNAYKNQNLDPHTVWFEFGKKLLCNGGDCPQNNLPFNPDQSLWPQLKSTPMEPNKNLILTLPPLSLQLVDLDLGPTDSLVIFNPNGMPIGLVPIFTQSNQTKILGTGAPSSYTSTLPLAKLTQVLLTQGSPVDSARLTLFVAKKPSVGLKPNKKDIVPTTHEPVYNVLGQKPTTQNRNTRQVLFFQKNKLVMTRK